MEHAVFADPSDLQLVLTRLVYEDRAALPLSWRRALGFRRMLAAAQAGSARRARTLAPSAGPEHPFTAERSGRQERRDPASCGTRLRRRAPLTLPSAPALPAARVRRAPVREIAVQVARTVREGRAFCTLDFSTEGLGRVQVFIRRRGQRIDCAILCPRERRALVSRALADARALLAKDGMALVTSP